MHRYVLICNIMDMWTTNFGLSAWSTGLPLIGSNQKIILFLYFQIKKIKVPLISLLCTLPFIACCLYALLVGLLMVLLSNFVVVPDPCLSPYLSLSYHSLLHLHILLIFSPWSFFVPSSHTSSSLSPPPSF